jgi:lipoprotein signal peptidase
MHIPRFNFKFLISLALVNLTTLVVVKNLGIWHIDNYAQELFRFGWISFFLIILLGFFVVTNLELNTKYPLILSIILFGIFCNIFERLYFGYVTDYLNFGIGVANFNDIEIYLGCMYILFKEISCRF